MHAPFGTCCFACHSAMNGRIPRNTGEYIVISDERHCHYRKVCGARASILKITKNIFSIAPLFDSTVSAGKSIRKPSILAVWASIFFVTGRPSNPKIPLIAACTCSCASVVCCRLPAPKKSSTKVNITHMHSAWTYRYSASPRRLQTIGVKPNRIRMLIWSSLWWNAGVCAELTTGSPLSRGVYRIIVR